MIVLFAALFAALQRNFPNQLPGISAGLVGLSISYSLKVLPLMWVQFGSTCIVNTCTTSFLFKWVDVVVLKCLSACGFIKEVRYQPSM